MNTTAENSVEDFTASGREPAAGILAGTGTLFRFFFRRDRFSLIWWTLGTVLLYWSQAVSIDGLYATQAEFNRAAASMENNAAFVAMAGPPRALDTIGGQVAWQASAWGAIVAGLMSMFLIGRHTRAEEESGRDELIRSGVVGRYAPLAAAVSVVSLANVILGAGVTASLIGYGLPTAGSISLGLALTLTGMVFMSIALLAAQLTETARAAYGITGAVIALSFVLRGVGDIGYGVLSWFSPIGWGQAMRAYAGEIWWPALVSAAAIAVIGFAALRVLGHRDIGAGVWPARRGPARGGATMEGAFGLSWRLQRGTLCGWTTGLFLTGLAYGSIGESIGDVIGDSQAAAQMMAKASGDLIDSFYSTTALMMALIATGFAVASILRLRGEENAGRVEMVLATALPRWRWVASHTIITLVGTILVVGAGGFGTGVSYAVVSADASQVLRLTGATLVHVPAVLIIAAGTLAVIGALPRLAGIGWLALAFCFVVMLFGAILQFPQWVMDISPFVHTPLLPSATMDWPAVLGLAGIAAGLAAFGFAAMRRRDIN